MAKSKVKELSVSELLGPEPPAPEPRSLSGEMEQLLPLLGQLGSMQSDQYIADQQRLLDQQYGWWTTHYHQMAEAEISEASRAQGQSRYDALKWLGDFGGHTRDVYGQMVNPTWGAAMGQTDRMLAQLGQRDELTQRLDQMGMDYLRTGGPTTPFTQILDDRALAELKLGGQLTPEAERMAQQSAREAYTARGQVGGNAAALAEVLNRDEMARQRQREREGIAGGRETAMLGRQQYGEQFAMGREQTELQRLQAERQYGLEAARIAFSADPNWAVLGQQSFSFPRSSEIMGLAQSVNTPSTGQIMGAGLNYGSDLFNTNLNMAAAQNISWQNNQAAMLGAQLQAQAQIQAAQAQASALGSAGSAASGGAIGGAAIGAVGAVAGGLIAF